MARPIELRQRVQVDRTRNCLHVTQTQGADTRSALIPLAEPTASSRQLHSITDYAHQWPRTEIDVTSLEFLSNRRSDSE